MYAYRARYVLRKSDFTATQLTVLSVMRKCMGLIAYLTARSSTDSLSAYESTS